MRPHNRPAIASALAPPACTRPAPVREAHPTRFAYGLAYHGPAPSRGCRFCGPFRAGAASRHTRAPESRSRTQWRISAAKKEDECLSGHCARWRPPAPLERARVCLPRVRQPTWEKVVDEDQINTRSVPFFLLFFFAITAQLLRSLSHAPRSPGARAAAART